MDSYETSDGESSDDGEESETLTDVEESDDHGAASRMEYDGIYSLMQLYIIHYNFVYIRTIKCHKCGRS